MEEFNNWEYCSLSEENYFEFSNGLWTGKKLPLSTVRVIRNTNFASFGEIDTSDVAQIAVEQKQFLKKKLLKGDVIIERSGGGPKQPVGRVVYFDLRGDYSFSNFTSLVRSRKREKIRPRFLFFVLLNFYFNADIQRYQSQTTGLRNLDFKKYKEAVKVPLISSSVQDKVAKHLDLVLSAIRKQEQVISATNELKLALMKKLFTEGLNGELLKETAIGLIPQSWELSTLDKMATLIDYGTSVKCSYEEKGHPVLRIPNIIDGKIDISDIKFGRLAERELSKLILEDGDLLFVRTNGVRENAGRCAVFHGELRHCYYASYLIRVRLKKDLSPDFFNYYAATETGQRFLSGKSTRTADGKFNINSGTIKAVVAPIPSIAEQLTIVNSIQSLDNKIGIHLKRAKCLKDLFQTLMFKFFNGEIRVNSEDVNKIQATTINAL